MEFIRDHKVSILVIIFAVLILGANMSLTAVSKSSQATQLNAQQSQILKLQNDIATQTAALTSGNSDVVQVTTGIDLARVAKDDEIAKAFIKNITTWSDNASYTQSREEVMQTYGLSEKSRFITTFLPLYPSIKDEEGNEFNQIDYNHLSCAYKGMKSIVTGISGDRYSYFTTVTCTGSRNGAAGDFNCIMMYTVNANGSLSDLDAYVLN